MNQIWTSCRCSFGWIGKTLAVSEVVLLRALEESSRSARDVEGCDATKYFSPQRFEKLSTRSCNWAIASSTLDSEHPVKVMVSFSGL